MGPTRLKWFEWQRGRSLSPRHGLGDSSTVTRGILPPATLVRPCTLSMCVGIANPFRRRFGYTYVIQNQTGS